MTGMTFAKFFPSDWRTGCLVLNLEEEGLYIRVCMYMYDTGLAVPSDDRKAASLLNVQVQKYAKVMASLIAKGKMFKGQGWVVNERVQAELDRWVSEQAARSLAAKKREAARKEYLQRVAAETPPPRQPPYQPPQQPPYLPGGGGLGGTPSVPQGVTGKNPNEINEGRAQPWQSRGTSWVNPESRSQKPQEEDSLSKAATDPEREKVIVNGSAIHGPGFKLDFKAIDMVAGLCGASSERARAIAEVCARDWAANGVKPDVPMARVKAAIVADFNQGQIQEVRLGKAGTQVKSRSAHFDELVDKAEAKKSVRRQV